MGMILNAKQMITEKNIKENTVVKENMKVKERALKDLDIALKSGLISKEVYEKARSKIIEEKKEIKKDPTPSIKEEKKEENIENKDKYKEKKQKSLNIIKKRHIKELEDMKKNWIKDLESLRNLHMHGIISDEEYEKSRADIEDKISKIEHIIKRELEKEELETLKNKIEREIKEAFQNGIFKEEEEQYRKDLDALENLYRRGLINKEEYEKKKSELKEKLENYNKLIELIDAIFNKYIEELSKKVESVKEETMPKTTEENEESKDLEKEKKEPRGIYKLLHKLGLYDIKEDKKEKNKLLYEINKAYKESEARFKISNIAMVLKKEIKNRLNINDALTYGELIEKIKESKEFDERLKTKLISFFESVIIKEYLEEEDEKDIELIYKEAVEIAQLLANTGKLTISSHKEEKKVEKEEGKLVTEKEKSKENKTSQTSKKEKKSIFDKINDFFGV